MKSRKNNEPTSRTFVQVNNTDRCCSQQIFIHHMFFPHIFPIVPVFLSGYYHCCYTADIYGLLYRESMFCVDLQQKKFLHEKFFKNKMNIHIL